MKWQNYKRYGFILMGVIILNLVYTQQISLGSLQTQSTGEVTLNWTFDADNFTINDIAISGDGNYIVVGGYNGTYGSSAYPRHGKLLFFSKDTSEPIWTYNESDCVNSVEISDEGKYVVLGDGDNNTYLLDTSARSILNTYDCGFSVSEIQISGDGTYYACKSNDSIYFFNRTESLPLWSYTASDYVNTIALSSNGLHLVMGTKDGKISLFNRSSNTPLWIKDYGTEIFDVDISDNGEKIVAGRENYTHVFSFDSSDPLWSDNLYSDDLNEDNVETVAISGNGEYIAITCSNTEFGTCYYKNTSQRIWDDGSNGIDELSIGYNGLYFSSVATSMQFLYSFESNWPTWNNDVTLVASNTDISDDGLKLIFDSNNRKIGSTRYSKLEFYTFTPPVDEEEKDNSSDGEPEQLGVSFGLWFFLAASISVAVVFKRVKPHIQH